MRLHFELFGHTIKVHKTVKTSYQPVQSNKSGTQIPVKDEYDIMAEIIGQEYRQYDWPEDIHNQDQMMMAWENYGRNKAVHAMQNSIRTANMHGQDSRYL